MNILKTSGINLPIAVQNSIQDVFEENDDINDVGVYFKNELENFETDITFENEVMITLGKSSEGIMYDHFTYYGDIDYSASENYKLIDSNNNEVQDISSYNPGINSKVIDSDDYAVVLIETVEWDSEGNISKTASMKIYAPVEFEEFEYQDVYNQVKENEV